LLKIIPLKEENLEDASALVSSRYKDLCEQEPHLPHRYKEVSNLLPLLQKIMQTASPGVAAIQDGRLVGFLVGWLMPDFRGKRSIYSPEWANAADSKRSGYIYEEMYGHLAADWVAGKYVAHYITMFADDVEALRVRGLRPIQGVDDRIDVRRAGPLDLEQIMELNEGLRRYVKGSPDFFIAEKLSKAYFEQWIQDPDRVTWLAYVNEKPVAFIRIGPARDDVCTIIRDEKTTSIYGAFTKEAMRGRNVGTTLLARAVESARSRGHERCAVDFEPMNLLGTRFWLRHDFRPVCLSIVRYVDERVL
jgi:GNAT superfamily N-acetyltransferase